MREMMEETTMTVGSGRTLRPAKLAALVAAAVAWAGFGNSALATETLTLKTVVSIPGGKITSFSHYFDMLTMLTQIGAMNTAAAA